VIDDLERSHGIVADTVLVSLEPKQGLFDPSQRISGSEIDWRRYDMEASVGIPQARQMKRSKSM